MFQDSFFPSQTLITTRRVDKENALSTQRNQKSFNKPTSTSTRKALGDLTNGNAKAPNSKKKIELVVKTSQPLVQKKTKKVLESIEEPEYVHLPKRNEKIRIAALDYQKVNPFLPMPSSFSKSSNTSSDLDEADIEQLDMPSIAEPSFSNLSMNLEIILPDLE